MLARLSALVEVAHAKEEGSYVQFILFYLFIYYLFIFIYLFIFLCL
jgi:hypothetical protein